MILRYGMLRLQMEASPTMPYAGPNLEILVMSSKQKPRNVYKSAYGSFMLSSCALIMIRNPKCYLLSHFPDPVGVRSLPKLTTPMGNTPATGVYRCSVFTFYTPQCSRLRGRFTLSRDENF